MKRGEIWTAVFSGDYGKPRPALVAQSDRVSESHPSVLLCPLTSEFADDNELRITVEPNLITGLRKRSQVMVDKLTALPKTKVRERIGRVDDQQLAAVQRTLLFLIDAINTESPASG